MNKKQLSVLSGGFYLLGILFSYLSIQWKGYCDINGEVAMHLIMACVRGHSFTVFPYLLFGLGIIFSIVTSLEPKK
tara:strand:+ start:78 stop:305 length:228 start_codon:yes stop_codon:yes gene_type:complete